MDMESKGMTNVIKKEVVVVVVNCHGDVAVYIDGELFGDDGGEYPP